MRVVIWRHVLWTLSRPGQIRAARARPTATCGASRHTYSAVAKAQYKNRLTPAIHAGKKRPRESEASPVLFGLGIIGLLSHLSPPIARSACTAPGLLSPPARCMSSPPQPRCRIAPPTLRVCERRGFAVDGCAGEPVMCRSSRALLHVGTS